MFSSLTYKPFLMRLFITSILVCSLLQVTGQVKAGEYLNLAVKYTESGRYAEAIKVCDKLIALDDKNPDFYYLRGVNRYLMQDYENSIVDFDITIELDPNYTDAYLKRAKAKKETNDLMGAFRDYNRAKNENVSQTLSSLAGDLIKSVFSGD